MSLFILGCGTNAPTTWLSLLQVLAIQNGKAVFRTVGWMNTHSNSNDVGIFVECALDNGLVLRATAGHYVPAGGDTVVQAVPQQMRELSVGMKLWVLLTSQDTPSAAYITTISNVQHEGHFSVHTASDGIVVDGVVAHEFSKHFPSRSVSLYKVVNTLPVMVTNMLPTLISKPVVTWLDNLANCLQSMLFAS